MARRRCGRYPNHRWKRKTKIVRPGVYQRSCTRCGRVENKKCGGFFSPHQFKRDRRAKKYTFKCKRCGATK